MQRKSYVLTDGISAVFAGFKNTPVKVSDYYTSETHSQFARFWRFSIATSSNLWAASTDASRSLPVK